MKIFITLATFIFLTFQSHAQQGEWTWVHGDTAFNRSGYLGTQGVSSPNTKPRALYEPCEWTDTSGNFWLFGGCGGGFTRYGDLFKYDPLINEWTWMKGSGLVDDTGSFGVQGISSSSNQPPSREHGVATWTDLSNNLWMFGGMTSINELNDLWKYDISTNEWTWMKGSNVSYDPGSYGTIGVPSPTNNPSSREEIASTWTDSNGDLWLFGGSGNLGAGYNDLWRYTIATNEWTWMKGSSISGQLGIYGTYQVEDTANVPGARSTYTHWIDNNGNFWFYGGEKFSIYDFNDMWRYNPQTNNWTWMNGSNQPGGQSVYGIKCIADSMNHPGTRYENRASWTDASGNFWTFGGKRGTTISDYVNELWKYCPSINHWIWIGGDTTVTPTGIWGTMGLSSPLNKPDGRIGSVGWKSNSGELYMFGGSNYSVASRHNDLWKYTIDTTCGICSGVPVAMFNSQTTICEGTCINFNNLSYNAISYHWSFPFAIPDSSNDINPNNICYNSPGQYDVQLIASNANGNDTLILLNYITVLPFPLPQGILQNGDTLFADTGAFNYQWFQNGNLIAGATDYFYVATSSGNYSVVATDANGCEGEAVINNVIANIQLAANNLQLAIFPNPVNDILEIKNPDSKKEISLKVFNALGVAVHLPTANCQLPTCSIDVSTLSSGVYILKIISADKIFHSPFVKK